MKIIHVLRKPLSESTVAANTLKHGTGGLNIDASRVAHTESVEFLSNRSGRKAGNAWADMGLNGKPHAYKANVSGRWPANVILQHLDGCRCNGVKRVKGARDSGAATPRKHGHLFAQDTYSKERLVRSTVGHADEDGKETVADWICEPGCPVERLDAQSGVFKSTGGRIGNKDGGVIYGGGKGLAGAYSSGDPGYGDTGGASRFYKQVGGKRVE